MAYFLAAKNEILNTRPLRTPWSLEQRVELIRLLNAAAHDARRTLAKLLLGQDLTEAEFLLLWACFCAAPAPVGQHELAVQVGLSKARTSGLVELLRRKTCLSGERSANDRRRQLWRVTTQGRRRVNDVLRQLGNDSSGSPEGSDADIYRALGQALAGLLAQVATANPAQGPVRGEAA